MKKLITKKSFHLKGYLMVSLMLAGMLGSSPGLLAQSQNPGAYCKPTWVNSATGPCSYSYGMRFLNVSFGNIYTDASTCYGSTNADCYRNWTGVGPKSTTTVVAGSVYNITAQTGYYTASPANYPMAVGAWIDYNRNNTFETAEWIRGTSQVLQTNSVGAIHSWNFTVPCNISAGNTRFRIVCQYGTAIPNSGWCNSFSYGEGFDYDVTLQLPTSLSASFVAPADAWVKSVVKFINSNQTGYILHQWDADLNNTYDNFPPYSNPAQPINFNWKWNTIGNKCVKLISTNCLGKDSTIKCVQIKAPTAVPVIDFVANKTLVEQYDVMQLFDLSTNGPWQWTWDVYDSTTYASSGLYPSLSSMDVLSDPNGKGNTETSQNPEFSFDVPGCYTVELVAKNDVGPSKKRRKLCYITVILPTDYLLGYGTFGPNNDNVVGSATGTIYDNGGINLNYDNNQGLGSRSYIQITPCNANKITLTMTQLRFKDAGDKLTVWDGKSPGGPNTTQLAQWTTGAKAPQKVVATSGSMYLLFESDVAGVDSGFIGTYVSELGPATMPTPAFMPNTIPSYNSTPVKFTNTTQNIVGVPTWEWTVDDNQVTGNGKKDFNYTFYTDGQYKVCLEIKSCVGNNKSCTTIDVVTPNQQTQLDFYATTRRPKTNIDITTLKPISDNANRFEWTIFPVTYQLMNPPGAPSSYGAGFVKYNSTPGDTIPTPRIKFTAPGCYTISLKAYNNLDPTNTTKTVVKNKFVCALDYCNPTAYIISSDVGINRVRLIDGSTDLINNYTPSGDVAYTDYSSTMKATLTYGKTYTIEISRNSSVDPANRKAWVDWNIDGDFDDAGEQIAIEASSYNQVLTATFTVPALANSFEGLTKLRVGINYNNELTTPCGPITAGEYEDYGLILANDLMPPVITMKGSDTVRIEVGSTYTDAGATAIDPSEGDITLSAPMSTTTDLDAGVTGLYTVEYNVTDKSGNKAIPAIRTIIVVNDLTKPVLTLNPGSSGCIEARRDNLPYVDPGANATDNKAPFQLSSSIVVTGSVDTRTIGVYTLTYYVQDVAGNSVTKVRNVCVEDTKPPVILALGDTSIQIGSVWLDQTEAQDAYDNSPALTKEWGFNGPVNTLLRRTYPVTYQAVDQSNNKAIPVTRNYRVDDFVPPVINLNTFDIVQHEVRTPYNSIAATVTDNFYPAGQVSLIKLSSNVNPNVLGTYTEVFEAVDGSGNVTQKTRTVNVVDTKAPRIWGEIIHGCVGENIWPMWGISTTDNYYSPAQLKPLVEIVNQNVNIWVEGLYTITYRVTDPSGNTSDEFTRMVMFTYWPSCTNSTVSVDKVKSIEESVSVYPNPSNGLVTLDLKGAIAEKATVEIYNAMGQLVMVKEFTEATGKFDMDLSAQASGVYTIKLIADGQVITKRVVIQ